MGLRFFSIIYLLIFGTASALADDGEKYVVEVCYQGECNAPLSQPLVRVPPTIPDTDEARRGGRVQFTFDAPADGGKVSNIILRDSDNVYFDDIARRSLERWYYAPYQVDGERRWRYGMIAKFWFLTPEEIAGRKQSAESKEESERLARIEENSYCGALTEPIMEMRAECVCKKDVLDKIPYTKTFMPAKPGYVAHFTQSTVDQWDGKQGFDIKAFNYKPIRLIGACKNKSLCTDGPFDGILGQPVDGPIEACVVATWHWTSFSKEDSEKVVSRGYIRNPMLFLQELPEK